jgi:O-antigen/teichoic acid export membrane protein
MELPLGDMRGTEDGRVTSIASAEGGIFTRATRGVGVLLVRHGITKAIGFLATLILARLLFPADYGVYAIVTFVVGLFATLGDLGLTGSLVQQSGEPERDDLLSVLTFQQLLALGASAVIFVAAPFVGEPFHLTSGDVWLVRLVSLGLFVTSFRSIPTAILTRHLAFTRLAGMDIAGSIGYQVIAVACALAGLGAWALGLAALAGSIVAALVGNALTGWPVGLRWNWSRVRRHLRFSIPYQGTASLAALELSAAPLAVGLLSGPAALGYVSFALTLVNLPLVFPSLIRQVAFPAMSRAQGDGKELARLANASLKANLYLCGGAFAILIACSAGIVPLMFGSRWTPAVDLVVLFSWSWMLRVTFDSGVTVLNALGRTFSAFTSLLSVALASLPLAFIFVARNGYIGIGEAWLLVALPLPLILVYVRRVVALRLLRAAALPWIVFCAAAVVGIAAGSLPIGSEPIRVLAQAGSSACSFAAMVSLAERRALLRATSALRTWISARVIDPKAASSRAEAVGQ